MTGASDATAEEISPPVTGLQPLTALMTGQAP